MSSGFFRLFPVSLRRPCRIMQSKEIHMKKIFALCALAGMVLVTGCNTMHGAGKDIERGGEKVQGAADNTKQKM
jgi:entericidin B